MKKKTLRNFLTLLISCLISLVAAELIFRWMIFGKSNAFRHLRNPGLYATEQTDDYWKLYNRFGGFFKPPANPQKLLGWIGFFDRDTYTHRDLSQVGNRRPVLLYGDSFAMCVDSVQCFQDILNNDTSFSKRNFLLNYGVGGYGVDQIYMLCSLTVQKFRDPFVVFSIMPSDMDRCVLSVRTGQKPYFTEDNGQLLLKGIPIEPDAGKFFKDHPPAITSYMWARFLHSDLNNYFHFAGESLHLQEKIKSLNEKIILKADSLLKSQGVQYAFMIFDNLFSDDGDWRVNFLTSLFNRHHIPYIYTADVVDQDPDFPAFNFDHYIIKSEGHPNSHYNNLVSQEIKKFVADYPGYSEKRMAEYALYTDTMSTGYFERKIRHDNGWLASVKEKALQRNIPLDSMIHLDALWLVEQKKNKK